MHLSHRARRRLIVLLIVMVGAAAAIVTVRSLREAQSVRLVEQKRAAGLRAYDAGDYDEALSDLSFTLSRNKDDLEVLLAFADTRANVPNSDHRHLAEAMGLYKRALQLDPGNATALSRLLEISRHPSVGDVHEAGRVALRIIEHDPDHVQANEALAKYELARREYDDALARIERLESLQPLEIEWRRLHLAVLRATEVPENRIAEMCADWADEFDEADGRFLLLQAESLAASGRMEDAEAVAEQAAARGVESPDVLRSLVRLLDRLGRPVVAAGLIDEAKTTFPQATWVWEEAIARAWNVGDLDATHEELMAAMSSVGADDPSLLMWRVKVLILKDERKEARDAIDQLRAVARDNEHRIAGLSAWASAAEAYLDRTGRAPGPVIAALREAIAVRPEDAILHYWLGDAYRDAEDLELAAKSFARSWQMDRGWIVSGVAYARTLLALGRPRPAVSIVASMQNGRHRASAGVALTAARAWLALAHVAGRQSAAHTTATDLPEITAALEDLWERSAPDWDPELASLLMQCHALAGDDAGARELAEDLLARDDIDPEVVSAAARTAVVHGLAVRNELIALVGETTGNAAEVVELRVLQALRDGRADDAVRIASDSAAAHPEEPSYHRLRAWALSTAGHADATGAMRQLIAASDDASDLFFVLEQDAAWNDPALIREAVEELKTIFSETASPRLLLAEASYLLRFESDDEATRAKALTLLNEALRHAPDSLGALVLMSRALLQGEHPDPEEAIRMLERAVRLYPAGIELYPRLIALYQEQGEYAKAASYLERLGRHADGDAELRRVEISLLKRQGDLDAVIARLGEIDRDRRTEMEQLSLAAMLMRTGRHAEAESIISDLLSRNATPSERIILMTAELYALTGRFEEGLAIIKQSPTPNAATRAMRLGAYARRHGRHDLAVRQHEEAIDLGSNNPNAYRELAETHLVAGRTAEARTIAQRGLEVDPSHTGLAVILAMASLDADSTTQEKAFELLHDLDAGDPALRATLDLARRADQHQPSSSDLLESIDLTRAHDDFLPAWRLAVTLHVNAGRHERALGLSRDAALRHPHAPAPAEWTVRILLRLERLEEALAAVETWRERSRHDPLQADVVGASIHLARGGVSEAATLIESHAERIFEERNLHPQRVRIALQALIEAGQIKAIKPRWRPILAREPSWRGVWLDIARVVSPEPAERMLAVVEPMMKDDPEGRLQLAAAWSSLARRSGDRRHLDRARAFAQAAEDHAEHAADALRLQGSLAEQRGDFQEAISLYRAVLEQSPDDPVTMNNLAFVLATEGQAAEEAVGLAERVVSLHPEVPAFLDTYAVALQAAGRLDAAARHARRAVELSGGEPEPSATLAAILADQSRFEEALPVIDSAIDLLESRPDADTTLMDRLQELRQRVAERQSVTLENTSEN